MIKATLFASFILVSNAYCFTEKDVLRNIKKFGKNLQKELKKGLKKSEIDALKICNIEAGNILNQHSTSEIKIGRVSTKNRNPQNRPKAWMNKYIEDFHAGKIKKSYIVVDLDDTKRGLLKPITTMPVCLKCHGENISKSTQLEINKLYPEDKAIGYKVGQIRGFFWGEFKKSN